MNFNIVEKEQTIITDELYATIKEEYLESDLSVKEIREKYNLTHIDWRNLSQQFRDELGVKCRPKSHCKYYYSIGNNQYRIIKWIGSKTIGLGTVSCTENTVREIVEMCKDAEWDIDVCKRIINGGWKHGL